MSHFLRVHSLFLVRLDPSNVSINVNPIIKEIKLNLDYLRIFHSSLLLTSAL